MNACQSLELLGVALEQRHIVGDNCVGVTLLMSLRVFCSYSELIHV